MLADASFGAVVTSDKGLIQQASPSFAAWMQMREDRLIGTPFEDLLTPASQIVHSTHVLPLLEISGSAKEVMLDVVRADGQRFPIMVFAVRKAAPDGRGHVITLSVFDATETRRHERELRQARQQAQAAAQALAYEASHDHLTGLSNRREFEGRLGTLARATEASFHHVLYVDVDQFKVVNDIAGHEVGDQLLVRVGAILKSGVRLGDTVARLGGDEFGLILPRCSREAAVCMAQALADQIGMMSLPWTGRSLNVTVSIGMFSFGLNATSAASVMAGADMACNLAKEQGRNRIQAFTDDDVRLHERRGEMSWAAQTRRAIAEDRLRLHFQPIVSLKPTATGLRHGEMLLRIVDDEGRLSAPSLFISAAERYNQIQLVDRWVVETAFKWLSSHPDHEASINLSGQSIGDAQLLPFVLRQFELCGLSPHRVCFEITETAAIGDLPSALLFMNALRAVGVRFALDDFGIGMSSFSYLKTLPVDFVKIDGSFTKTVLTDPVNKGIVEAIVQIAKLCGLQTIAEWVETEDVRDVLQRIGVDHAQGWLIGKPMPLTSGHQPRANLPC